MNLKNGIHFDTGLDPKTQPPWHATGHIPEWMNSDGSINIEKANGPNRSINPHTNQTGPHIHTTGGSIISGGHMMPEHDGKGGAFLPMPSEFPSTPKDAYHHILGMSPHQLELHREISSQLLGGVPSHMWGNVLGDEHKQLEADPEHYENIIRMPNTHSMARMLEADHGSGFFDALKHVGRIAANVYKSGRTAAQYLNKYKDPLITAFGLDAYKPQIDAFAHRMSDMDSVVNPLVNATLASVKHDPLPEMKQNAMNIAQAHLKNAALIAAGDVMRRTGF